MAPKVNVYALKVLNQFGSGDYSDIVSALEWCVLNHMQVANLSLGSTSDPGSTVKAAFDNAAAAACAPLSSLEVGSPARASACCSVLVVSTPLATGVDASSDTRVSPYVTASHT